MDAATQLMVEALKRREAQAQMPFPDNNNPDTDFVNRWPNLPPSGILNDMRAPTGATVPLVRKIGM